MKTSSIGKKRRAQPPVQFYLTTLAFLMIAAVVFGTQYGRAKQNPATPPATTGQSGRTP